MKIARMYPAFSYNDAWSTKVGALRVCRVRNQIIDHFDEELIALPRVRRTILEESTNQDSQ